MSESNLLEKISSVSNEMFPVSYEERTMERTVFGTVGDIIIETVTYLVCTISPFNESVLLKAFDLDLEAEYGMGISNREYVEYMTESLRKTLAEEV